MRHDNHGFHGLLGALGLLALGLLGSPVATAAQSDAADITAEVTILLPPTTGSGLQPLEFGEVFADVDKEVQPTGTTEPGTSVGWFQIENIAKGQDVDFTFTFPVVLDHADGGPGMPVSFTDGEYVATCDPDCQLHTPTVTSSSSTEITATATHVRPGPPYGPNSRTIDVYVGGRASPTATQAAGFYQGTISLTYAEP